MRLRHKRRLRALYRKWGRSDVYLIARERWRFLHRRDRAWRRFLAQWPNARARWLLSPEGTAAALAGDLSAPGAAWDRWVLSYDGNSRRRQSLRASDLLALHWHRSERCP